MKRKYTAYITEDCEKAKYVIEGYATTPQEFHKSVICGRDEDGTRLINWRGDNYGEEVLFITNEAGKEVFNLRRGFSGS